MTSDLVAEARARAHTLDDPLDTALLLALADALEISDDALKNIAHGSRAAARRRAHAALSSASPSEQTETK